jgi:nucleotide-binding universal stress UspA family protein
MRAIIGIDTKEAYKPTVELFAKLKFTDSHLTLMHAAPVVCPITAADARAEAEYTKVVQNLGLAALDAAAEFATAHGIEPRTKLVFGRAADSLILEAQAEDSELIGLRATHRGSSKSSYLGSATCALAINSPTSLLVAKGPFKSNHEFTAVLATDHSNTSDKWIERFLNFGPKGISRLHILSAYEVNDEVAAAAHKNLAMLGGDVARWLNETIAERTEAVADKLAKAGLEVTFSVVETPATDAIRNAMRDTHADLLIIGAHGNTQPPGAKIGSVALHQVVAEHYPILMIQP